MTVLVVGKDQQLVNRASCRNCSSILEYINSDIQERKHYDYGGGCDIYKIIICPCCTNEVTVK